MAKKKKKKAPKTQVRASGAEMTSYTFNPWWGYTRISPACDRCYANSIARRHGHKIWGSGSGGAPESR